MDPEKILKLNDTYQKFIDLGFYNLWTDDTQEFILENIMGYGTNQDEKILSLSDLRELVLRQKQQSVGIEIQYDRSPVFKKITSDENVALFVEEVKIIMLISDLEHLLDVRITTVLEYINGNWMAIHWHASLPVATNESSDPYNLDELNRKNKELQKLVDEKTKELRMSLDELKSTQALLIQSEKMASLGELTAGIAHEIQNPLNFVNNFSEVNNELIEELKNEKRKVKSERDENLEDELIETIRENEEKINHHGKRADAIVKSMLQHSRGADGANKKEPTDVNALADEYFRVAYHSFKSKQIDSPEIKLVTDFDNTLPLVNIVPQDIGRVLLNLFYNAFWATTEKCLPAGEAGKTENGEKEKSSGLLSSLPTGQAGLPPFLPQATLITKNFGDHIEVRIHDNGPGIPQNIIDKIFQPFFTTKPTGQGTGLGLSLAYDIVKAHGGEIKVETKEGEGTEFIILLPASA